MVLCINPRAIEFDETINVLKFSDLVKDILVPTQATTDIQRHVARYATEKAVSVDTLEHSCSQFFSNYLEANHYFIPEAFPCLNVFAPEDQGTITNLIEFLEEYRKKHTPFVHVS
jgi:hypothetical protein